MSEDNQPAKQSTRFSLAYFFVTLLAYIIAIVYLISTILDQKDGLFILCLLLIVRLMRKLLDNIIDDIVSVLKESGEE